MTNPIRSRTEAAFLTVATLRGWVPGMPRAEVEAMFTPEEWADWTRLLSAPRTPQTFSATATHTWDDEVARDERDAMEGR
jgi:hypothetical protein